MTEFEQLADALVKAETKLGLLNDIVKDQQTSGVERFDREGFTPEFVMALAARFELDYHEKRMLFYRISQLEKRLDDLILSNHHYCGPVG